MKLIFFSNKFPTEEPSDIFRQLRRQSRSDSHIILRQLLKETTLAVRDEIRLLPAELRSCLPPFRCILDLAEHYDWHRGPLSGTFECVFLCLSSLGLFVGDYEGRAHEFSFTQENTVVTGLGLGFLAATAVIASPSLSDFPHVAADVIRVAMRVGLVVYQTSQDLDPKGLDAPLRSWTTLVKGLGEEVVQRELEHFNESTGAIGPGRLYISVVEPDGSVFVNGPPSRMQTLFKGSGLLASAPRAPLPVYGGPCHASHLYDRSHVSWALQHVRADIAQRSCFGAARLLSMEDGQPLGANTVLELLENATQILLTSIIRWGRVVAALKEDLWQTGLQGEQSEEATTDLRIESCRSPPVVEGLVSTLREAHPDLSITAHDLAGWLSTVPTEHSKNGDDTKIAVVGMSCRLPGGGDDLEHFWQILEEGQDAHHQHVPADRYDVQTHTDPTGRRPNTSQTPFGCFVDNPGLFDASFFDMSPREAGQTDPTHRLALLTAYEALENSGYVPDRTFSTTRQTVGTIYGQCSDDYREANAGQEIDMYFIPGNYRAFAPGRISYFFKFSGSSFSCDTACSASLAAVQIACAALGHGEANMVVAGGLNIITSSDSFAGLSRAYFLSKTGGCKVFDDGADGYCRADGVGSLVLKRLPDAQKDNDKILGVILATGTNHSSAAVSLTHPHAPTQERLYRSVLSEAGISPLDVDLVEMHGTGTQAGDAAEMESVTNVFSPSDGRGARRSETLHIGSVKANLGHGEAAAGVTALIKALLILKHNAIPKHVGIKTQLNSKFPDLERLNVHIPTDTIPWPRRADRKRYIMVNNFSAAGGNTSLVVAEPPERPPPEPRGWPGMGFVVCVSAKSGISLHRNLKRLIAYIEDHSTSIHLPSLSYTSTARRIHHVHRIAVHGCSIEEVLKSLRLRLPETTDAAKQRAMPVGAMAAPRIAFVFSGQGSFYTGISRALVEHYPPYKKEIQRLDRLCLLHGFPSILPGLELGGHDVANLTPIVAQLTTVCVQVALYRLWTSLGVAPHIVIGASIGEYAALHAAGALSASEIIYLVGHRALLMQELCTANTHTMLAVQATVEQVRQCVHDSSLYEVACVNSPNSITLAGTIANIDAMKISLESQGYRTAPLNVAYAFHSSHIEPTIDRFDALAVRVSTRPLKIPLISPLLRDTIYAGQELPETYLRDATRQTVHFWEALENACEQDLIPPKTAFVEIGIHPTYSSAVRAIVPDTAAIVSTLRSDEDNWNTLTGSMAKLYEAGVHLGWNELYKPYESELRLLDLPTYQWNLKNYWIQHNGDWLLTKDRPPCTSDSAVVGKRAPAGLRSPLVHRIVEEDFSSGRAKVVVESDAHDDEFFAVASAHKMSGRPVVSVFSYPDMVLSLAKYIYSRIRPNSAPPGMDFGGVHILQGLLPWKNRSQPQMVRLRIETPNLHDTRAEMSVAIYVATDDEELATGTVTFGDHAHWTKEWESIAYLVTSRIETLHTLARDGQADRFTKAMVYLLFKNIVDYSPPYHGIQSAVVHGLEAVADIILTPTPEGRWSSAPPNHIDSIAHVGGFVLNAGHATNHAETMYVMEGWKSMRFAKPLVAGTPYRSYVKMVPAADGSGFFSGDVYLLDADTVIALIGGMTLRPLPRILMGRFFDPPDPRPVDATTRMQIQTQTEPPPTATTPLTPTSDSLTNASPSVRSADTPATPPDLTPENKILSASSRDPAKTNKALALIASETRVDLQELTDETHLSQMGIDSLLSLVLVEKFALELNIHLQPSFFLESPTIGMIKAQLAG